jgi:hypothetical protein
MSYQNCLKAHLASYKRATLGDLPAGSFDHHGRLLACGHILPTSNWPLNLIAESRDKVLSFLRANPQIKLHKYFHHLNSSQAFALNLFVPYFEGGLAASSALLGAFGQWGRLGRWDLEAIPDPTEGTNLDAVWDTEDGTRTFCEVKLSESGFGTAPHDERHHGKLQYIYLPRLAPHLSPELQTAVGFFGSYQTLRNIWHLVGAPKGRLVFLLPRANRRLWSMLDVVLNGVTPQVRARINCVAIEDVFSELTANTACPAGFRTYAARLREKYVPEIAED